MNDSSANTSTVGAVSSTGNSSATNTTTVDERVVAQAALEAAEDALESLCANHAGTFVAVEKRSQAVQKSLEQLRVNLEHVQRQVKLAQFHVGHAQQSEQEAKEEHEFINDDDDDDQDTSKTMIQLLQNRPSLAELSDKHRVRRRTLLQHSALLELLELPSLMDACVRSNLYEEALSIAELANAFERNVHNTTTTDGSTGKNSQSSSSSSSFTIVSLVIDQIRSRQTDLQRHLLQRLEGPVTMPDCLEVVTALRRLNSILMETHTNNASTTSSSSSSSESLYQSMETQLQIEFLEARNVWLDSTLTTNSTAARSTSSLTAATSSSSSTAEDLLDLIERYRTRVFEIATQFHAIFRVNNNHQTHAAHSTTDLLALWTARRIQVFLTILQQGLHTAAAQAEALTATTSTTNASTTSTTTTSSSQQQQQQQYGAATLRDLLEATLFFSSSMGRLGADFTSYQIPKMFEDALCQWIVQSVWMQQGVKPFQQVLQLCCVEAQVAAPLVATALRHAGSHHHHHGGKHNATSYLICWTLESSQQVKQALADFHLSDKTSVLEQPPGPLRIWMQVPPLGRLVNAILLGLNELRRCLLPSALPRLEHALEEQVLQVVTHELKQIERQLITTPGVSGALRELISKEYVPLWNQLAVPFVRGSFWTAVGREGKAMEYYRQVESAIHGLVEEKEAAEQAILDKQRQEEVESEEVDDDGTDEQALEVEIGNDDELGNESEEEESNVSENQDLKKD